MKYDPELLHVSPRKVIIDAFKYVKEFGAKKFLRSPENTRLRDNFLVSCFAFGLRKIYGDEFYLKEVVGDPPDFEIVRLTGRPVKEKPFDRIIGEMVTVPDYVDLRDFLEESEEIVVGKKFREEKAYEKGTVLLVFINSTHASEISDHLREALSDQSKYPMIWTLYFTGVNSQVGFEYAVNQIYPNYQKEDVVLCDEMKKKSKIDGAQIERYLPKGNIQD